MFSIHPIGNGFERLREKEETACIPNGNHPKTDGICEICGLFSEELVNFKGKFLCKECVHYGQNLENLLMR